MKKINPCVCGKTPEITRDKSSSIIWPYFVLCPCGRFSTQAFREENAIYNWNRMVITPCPSCSSPDTYQAIADLTSYECGECAHKWVAK